MTFIAFLLIIAAIVGGALAFAYFFLLSMYREQKNYERGLKMVPLLIHLPPPSDDLDKQGRDTRDMAEENISRAMTLYNILASTFQKGLKHKLYGQRHIALEIVATNGAVRFYAAVPVPMQGVIEQAVLGAYPTARLEEVVDHNIFNQVGRITGTLGGELNLKESFAYPIGTYQEIKRDSMSALLNSLSTLTKEDGAGVQILLRPAEPGWRKKATSEADKRRLGKPRTSGVEKVFSGVGQSIAALNKPPNTHDPEKPLENKKDDVSTLDQSISQAIEEKTKQPAFEVMIRVVASSNISHRAQTILNTIVATFSLFDAPGKNGFKFVPARDIDTFITAYNLRFFPQNISANVLNSIELATIFHFPDQQNIPTSQLERQASKQVDGPRNVPEHGLLLGYNMFRGAKKAIRLDDNDRRRHMYIVGQTGTGKSVFMENLALQDMLEGKGFAFVDPHGDTAERLLSMVPKERTEDVIYFSPAEMDYPLGLNMFEFHNPDQKDFLIQESINMLYKLYDPGHTGIIGPRYEHIFRNAALTVMADPEGGTFVDIPKLFRDTQFVEQKLKHVTDQNVLEFWRKEIPQSQRSSEYGEVTSWFVSKFGAFLSNEMMRNIIGQTKSSFDLRNIMDSGKILLVNLSRGRTGDLNSKLLGMIFVMKFEEAAMSRADVPEEYRRDFCLYVDEFQNFSTDSFADILSQARKYHLNLIVANQFTTQLKEEIRDAVFGNVGTVVSFRVGTTDAEFLAKQFAPVFDIEDLQFIPNYNTAVRMMIGGVPVQPFSMATLPPLGSPNKQLAQALMQLSAAKYGRPREAVEKEIFKRLETKAPSPQLGPGSRSPDSILDELGLRGRPGMAPPAGGGASSAFSPPPSRRPLAPPSGPPPSNTPKQQASGSSFLDEWLSKRKNAVPTRVPSGPPPAANPSSAPTPRPASPHPSAQAVASTASTAGPPAAQTVGPKPQQVNSTPQSNPPVLKINRDESKSSNKGEEPPAHTIKIDRDGNLSYDN